MTHEFGFRFRNTDELEGSGSMMIKFEVTDPVTNAVRQTVTEVLRQHPTVMFDGMIYYGSRETA
jgi:hypothetical protein